ncbi:MAG TPA: T9SS type A sorting domain-containing protein [Chryseolinea sp.]|nr:T9SS type A sorting domain-containing protein [Chryseolinea sp.]
MNQYILLRAGCKAPTQIPFLQPLANTIRIAAKRIPDFLLVFLFMTGSLTDFGQATQVVITTQPDPGSGHGTPMSVQPVVEIRDASDLLVTTSTAQVEIVIASGTGGSLGGTTRINAVNGIATFTDLTFTGIANELYVFEFRSEPVIVSEPFAYGGGTLTGNNGGTGWSGAWFGPHSGFTDLDVNTTGFSYTGFATSGGRSTYVNSTGGDGGRYLAAVSNAVYGVVWLSFLANYDQQGGGFSNVRLYLPGGLTGGVGGNGGIFNWSILDNGLNAGATTSVPLNGTEHLALLKIDYTAGTSSLWIDPTVSGFDGTQTPSATVSFAPVFDRIELYNRYFDIGTDELTLGSTYKAALHREQNLVAAVSLAAVVPVKWSYFTGTCDGATTLLKWGTTNETNNSHFIVEKSINALTWSVTGNVQGMGNSSVDQRYEFNDSASSLKTYYRLRQVDFNGKTNLSKVVVVNCEISGSSVLRVFPNPASDFLQVIGAQPGSRYDLIDARGHSVRTGIVLSGTGAISLSGLPAGSYFLRVAGYNSRPVHILKAGR